MSALWSISYCDLNIESENYGEHAQMCKLTVRNSRFLCREDRFRQLYIEDNFIGCDPGFGRGHFTCKVSADTLHLNFSATKYPRILCMPLCGLEKAILIGIGV